MHIPHTWNVGRLLWLFIRKPILSRADYIVSIPEWHSRQGWNHPKPKCHRLCGNRGGDQRINDFTTCCGSCFRDCIKPWNNKDIIQIVLWQQRSKQHWLRSGHHYTDVTMSPMASKIASLAIVYSTVYLAADQRKHQSSMSMAFVRIIHRNSPHKRPVTRKMFPFDDVIMMACCVRHQAIT